jgi:hypothetical protein
MVSALQFEQKRPQVMDRHEQRRLLPVPAETAQFLDILLGYAGGLVELAFCPHDPSQPGAPIVSAGWFDAGDQVRLGQEITRLSNRHGDVYISLSQHSAAERTYSTALPSCWLWLDDVHQIDPDAAMVLETSSGNYQVLYRVDQALTAVQRSDWQRRARACAGADSCSADAVHLIRIPGTLNTKQGQNWRVRLAHTCAGDIDLAQLAQRWPAADVISSTGGVELAESDVSAALEQIATLRKVAHERLKPTSLAYRTLTGKDHPPSQSEARYRVIYGLVTVGFANVEIAALIWHWSSTDGLSCLTWGHLQKRATADRLTDIARCISKVRATLVKKGQAVTIRPALKQRSTLTFRRTLQQPRARDDRPVRLTGSGLLTWLDAERAGDRVVCTQQDIAAAFSCSVPTVKRVEAVLTAAGHIKREKRGRLTYVILLDHHRGEDEFMRSSSRHDPIKISTNTAAERTETDVPGLYKDTLPDLVSDSGPGATLEPEPGPVVALQPDRESPTGAPVGECVSNAAVSTQEPSGTAEGVKRDWTHGIRPRELYTLIYGMRDSQERMRFNLVERESDPPAEQTALDLAGDVCAQTPAVPATAAPGQPSAPSAPFGQRAIPRCCLYKRPVTLETIRRE